MNKITRRDVIRQVLKSAKSNYSNRSGVLWNELTADQFIQKLSALDLDTCTPEEVDAIWGHNGWNSMPFCGHCGDRDQDVTYQIGEEADYESRTAYLCQACIAELVREYLEAKP